jgi:hypothetical protein
VVKRGHSYAACNDAIADAAIADAKAQQEREEARQRRNQAASRASLGHPERNALVEPRK